MLSPPSKAGPEELGGRRGGVLRAEFSERSLSGARWGIGPGETGLPIGKSIDAGVSFDMFSFGPFRPDRRNRTGYHEPSPNDFGFPNGFGRGFASSANKRTTSIRVPLGRSRLRVSPSSVSAPLISLPPIRELRPSGGKPRRSMENVAPRNRSRRTEPTSGELRARHNSASDRFRKLRVAEEVAVGDRLLLASLRIRIPPGLWTGAFTSAHPNLSAEILNRADVSKDVSVSDYWISGQPPGVWAREIGQYSDVLKVDSLAEVGEGSIYRVTYRNPPVIYLYRELGMPIQFPMRLQGGFIRWEIVARHSEFEKVLKHVGKTDPDFQVVSIRRRPLRSHLPMLTENQQQLLTQAMAAGYFAVPRGITLTALARRLDRSKSGISEAIAIIEKKLLESALRPTSLSP
jgi:predicted DNA binding protein